MVAKQVGRLGLLAASLLLLSFHSAVYASATTPLYAVTNLGPNYTLQTDSSGAVQSVTNGDGSLSYAFDKSPVTSISDLQNGGSHADSYTLLTLQNGSIKVGYRYDYGGGLAGTPLGSGVNYPTFEPVSNGWFTQAGSPVADLNSHGQVVGTSTLYSSLLNANGPLQTYAAFSDPQGNSHGFGAAIVDNLNNYIADAPGIVLTSGLKIDDLGRIIAAGTLNGQQEDFLLSPIGLSNNPIPAPEPGPIVSLAVGVVALACRSLRRRARATTDGQPTSQ